MSLSIQEQHDLKRVLTDFVRRMAVDVPPVTFDAEFAEEAVKEGLQHYQFTQPDVQNKEFRRALQAVVTGTRLTCGHLENIRTQYWITLYTTCIIWFDDLWTTNPAFQEGLREFHLRFISGQSQKHHSLDSYASIIRKCGEHFPPSAAHMIISKSQDFIAGLIFEDNYRQIKVHQSANNFPRFWRTITGVGGPYAFFAFPPSIPLQVYIQAVPDMENFINDVNDIFSFYKEQLENVDNNHISLLASLHGWTKLQALEHLSDYAAQTMQKIKDVISSHQEAYEILMKYWLPGYLAYHVEATKRYRLDDLLSSTV